VGRSFVVVSVLVFRARRDVVDINLGNVVPPVLVVLVEAADGPFLDRTARAPL